MIPIGTMHKAEKIAADGTRAFRFATRWLLVAYYKDLV